MMICIDLLQVSEAAFESVRLIAGLIQLQMDCDLLNALFVVRLWHSKPDQLAARCASLKNAFISMGGAVVHHATVPENARQLFYQTWPGWTFGAYRAFDLPAEDSYLADLIPWSATFTGHLEGAEAIYNGARGNLVGVRTRLGNTPQHGVLFGMTGAGKSVIIADLLAQIGHRFGFRLIVEEGLSHAVLTQTQGCEPVIIIRTVISDSESIANK